MVQQNISVGAVSYLNTKPMITPSPIGTAQAFAEGLIINNPAAIAAMLINREIQVGLVPVAILPQLGTYYQVSNYGIGCTGAVSSVCLYSNVPITEVTTLYLDTESRTSVQLLQVLLREYWQLPNIILLPAYKGYESDITGTVAGLVIGDRAFIQKKINTYEYDLGEAWYKHTGLPFVFALWVSTVVLNSEFKISFNNWLASNHAHYMATIDVKELTTEQKNYLQHNIQYKLTALHYKGLQLFLSKL